MIRLIEFNFDEVVINPKECSEAITAACRRENAAVSGVCSNEHTLIIVIDSEAGSGGYYRLAQFPGFSKEEISGEINSRWTAGFATVGSFFAGKNLWGLFMTQQSPESSDDA